MFRAAVHPEERMDGKTVDGKTCDAGKGCVQRALCERLLGAARVSSHARVIVVPMVIRTFLSSVDRLVLS